MRPFGPSKLTVAQQYYDLRACALCHGEGSVRAGSLVWTYDVAPTPISRIYTVRIEHQRNDSPQVFVLDPDLVELAGGRRLPHVYAQRPAQLCLWYPKHKEWTPNQFISRTFVPWISVWLLYYEEWLSSDDWKGGGIHPQVIARDDSLQVRRTQPLRRR